MVMQGNPIAELSEEKRENRKLRQIVSKQNVQLVQKDTYIKALEGDIIEIDKTVNTRISSLRRRITEDVLLTQGKEAKIRYAISELCDLQQIVSSEFLIKLEEM